MRKKFWKILGVSLVVLTTLLLLFVVAFVFNPFEGALPDMRELVPRNIDYFLRKVDLREDFSEFPKPNFWNDLKASSGYRVWEDGETYRELALDQGLDQALSQLADASAQVAETGVIDLLDDFLGEEVIICGRLVPSGFADSEFCLYTRVSLTARFAWGLAQWPSVQVQMAREGLNLAAAGEGRMQLTLPGQPKLYLARYLDCLMISNSSLLLDESLELAESISGASDSFGGSADYRDGVEGRIRDWERTTGVERANAIEFYLRPDRVLPMIPGLDNWPDARHPEDWNQRVLASFLNFSGWRFLTSSLIFEEDSLTILGRVDLNRNNHTPFQAEFFKAEPQARRLWLDDFLGMVPGQGACAAAALRMPAGEFLAEMHDAMEPGMRTLLDESLRKTGKYENTRDLIDKLRPALLDRTGFVFFPAREETEFEVYEPSPAPLIAWVFWIREGAREPIQEFYDFLETNYKNLGFPNAYNLTLTSGSGGDKARSYANPNIPGTGHIAILVYGRFFVVSNSDYLIRYMIKARSQGGSLLENADYARIKAELNNRLNGFVFINGKQMERVIDDYLEFMERGYDAPDPGWLESTKSRYERQIFRTSYLRFRSINQIPDAQLDKFRDEVYEAQTKAWAQEKLRFLAGDRNALIEAKGLCRLFSSAYLQLGLDPQAMSWTSRFLMEYR